MAEKAEAKTHILNILLLAEKAFRLATCIYNGFIIFKVASWNFQGEHTVS